MVFDSPARRKAPPRDPQGNTLHSSSPQRRPEPRPLSPNNTKRNGNHSGGVDLWTKTASNNNNTRTARDARQLSPGRATRSSQYAVRQESPPTSPPTKRPQPPSPERRMKGRGRVLSASSGAGDEWFAVQTTPKVTVNNTSPTKWGRSVMVQDSSNINNDNDFRESDDWRFVGISQDSDDGGRSLYDDSGAKIMSVLPSSPPASEGSPSRPISIHDMSFLDEREQGILAAAQTKHDVADERDHDVLRRAAAKRTTAKPSSQHENSSVSSKASISSGAKNNKNKQKGGGIMGFFRGAVSLFLVKRFFLLV